MADLYCTIAADSSDAELLAEILATEATHLDSELEAEFTSTAGAESAARPRDLTPSVVGFELRVGGTVIALEDSCGSWSVQRSIDQRLQTWQIEFPLADADGVFGSPFDTLGPATCLDEVDLYGVYLVSGAKVLVPLIKGGVADVCSRVADSGGYRETLSGVDRGGRYDRKVVTLILNPGHGLPRGYVVRELAQQAGETQHVLTPGRSCTKEVQVVDGDWLSVASELMDTEGRGLLWDRDGYLANPYRSRPSGESTTWELVEKDFDASTGVSVQHQADILTDVTLTSWEQVTREGCQQVESRTEVEAEGIYQPAQQAYYQEAGGYTGTTPAAAASLRRVSLIVSESESHCGTVTWERTRQWGWKNWETGRYTWDAVSDEWDRRDCYTNDNADEANPGYEYEQERWCLVQQVESWHFYRWDGFGRTTGSVGYDLDSWVGTPYLGQLAFWGSVDGTGTPTVEPSTGQNNPYGTYLGSITQTSAPLIVPAHVKDRALTPYPPDAWDDVEFDASTKILGGGSGYNDNPTAPWSTWSFVTGTGYSGDAEKFLGATQEVVSHLDYDSLGYLQRERRMTWGWWKPELVGATYLYADGTESNDEAATFSVFSRQETIYEPTDEATHSKTTITYNADGQTVVSVQERGLEGAGPQLARLNLPEASSNYEGDEQAEYAADASRKDTRQIKVQVVATALETCHSKGVLKTEMPWAESEDELVEIAERMIADSAAATISATLAGCNYFVEPGQLHRWKFRPLGLDHDIRITSVTWAGQVGGKTTCTVEGKVYGW